MEREKAEQDIILDAISRKLDGISDKASAIRDEAKRQRALMDRVETAVETANVNIAESTKAIKQSIKRSGYGPGDKSLVNKIGVIANPFGY